MLSMRNGLYLAPSNLSGALAPSEMCATNLQSGGKALNSRVGLLPVNQISTAHNLFESPNHDQRHDKPFFLPSVPNAAAVAPQFLQEPSQSSIQSFELSLPPEVILEFCLEYKLPWVWSYLGLFALHPKSAWLRQRPLASDFGYLWLVMLPGGSKQTGPICSDTSHILFLNYFLLMYCSWFSSRIWC